jgi:molecular chaperone GrpE
MDQQDARSDTAPPPADDPAGGAGSSALSGSEDLEARLAACEDRWRRTAADLDNFRKRTARELDAAREAERRRVASVFLPVIDGLEQASGFIPAEDDALRAGIEAVRGQAIEALNRLGYPRIDDVGAAFDPELHEVVTVVETPDVPPQSVVGVLRPGYGTAGRVLRPASVVVTPGRS